MRNSRGYANVACEFLVCFQRLTAAFEPFGYGHRAARAFPGDLHGNDKRRRHRQGNVNAALTQHRPASAPARTTRPTIHVAQGSTP